jgi:hypothetical protein
LDTVRVPALRHSAPLRGVSRQRVAVDHRHPFVVGGERRSGAEPAHARPDHDGVVTGVRLSNHGVPRIDVVRVPAHSPAGTARMTSVQVNCELISDNSEVIRTKLRGEYLS